MPVVIPFKTAGTYLWECPRGVTSAIVEVGGGTGIDNTGPHVNDIISTTGEIGGDTISTGACVHSSGGSGGGARTRRRVPLTVGAIYTIVVDRNCSFSLDGTVLVSAPGGELGVNLAGGIGGKASDCVGGLVANDASISFFANNPVAISVDMIGGATATTSFMYIEASSNVVINSGDLFTLPNDSTIYTVTGYEATAIINRQALSFTPALLNHVLDDAAITLYQPADAAAAVNHGGGYAVGSTVMLVDGFAGAVSNGDIFYVDGDSGRPHVITAHSETLGNTTSITFTPAIDTLSFSGGHGGSTFTNGCGGGGGGSAFIDADGSDGGNGTLTVPGVGGYGLARGGRGGNVNTTGGEYGLQGNSPGGGTGGRTKFVDAVNIKDPIFTVGEVLLTLNVINYDPCGINIEETATVDSDADMVLLGSDATSHAPFSTLADRTAVYYRATLGSVYEYGVGFYDAINNQVERAYPEYIVDDIDIDSVNETEDGVSAYFETGDKTVKGHVFVGFTPDEIIPSTVPQLTTIPGPISLQQQILSLQAQIARQEGTQRIILQLRLDALQTELAHATQSQLLASIPGAPVTGSGPFNTLRLRWLTRNIRLLTNLIKDAEALAPSAERTARILQLTNRRLILRTAAAIERTQVMQLTMARQIARGGLAGVPLIIAPGNTGSEHSGPLPGTPGYVPRGRPGFVRTPTLSGIGTLRQGFFAAQVALLFLDPEVQDAFAGLTRARDPNDTGRRMQARLSVTGAISNSIDDHNGAGTILYLAPIPDTDDTPRISLMTGQPANLLSLATIRVWVNCDIAPRSDWLNNRIAIANLPKLIINQPSAIPHNLLTNTQPDNSTTLEGIPFDVFVCTPPTRIDAREPGNITLFYLNWSNSRQRYNGTTGYRLMTLPGIPGNTGELFLCDTVGEVNRGTVAATTSANRRSNILNLTGITGVIATGTCFTVAGGSGIGTVVTHSETLGNTTSITFTGLGIGADLCDDDGNVIAGPVFTVVRKIMGNYDLNPLQFGFPLSGQNFRYLGTVTPAANGIVAHVPQMRMIWNHYNPLEYVDTYNDNKNPYWLISPFATPGVWTEMHPPAGQWMFQYTEPQDGSQPAVFNNKRPTFVSARINCFGEVGIAAFFEDEENEVLITSLTNAHVDIGTLEIGPDTYEGSYVGGVCCYEIRQSVTASESDWNAHLKRWGFFGAFKDYSLFARGIVTDSDCDKPVTNSGTSSAAYCVFRGWF